MTNIKVLNDAVSVKKAVLIKSTETSDNIENTTYTLQHYQTIILVVRNGKIELMKNHISVSSTRAINQALEFLGFDKKARELEKELVLTQ